MQSKGPVKHFILAFMLALAGYAVFYQDIEYWRARKGPWRVTFAHTSAHAPVITVDQPALAITNVQIIFALKTSPPPTRPPPSSSPSRAPCPAKFPLANACFSI